MNRLESCCIFLRSFVEGVVSLLVLVLVLVLVFVLVLVLEEVEVFLSVGSVKASAAKAIFRAGGHEINISHRYWGFSARNKGRISKGYKKEIQ